MSYGDSMNTNHLRLVSLFTFLGFVNLGCQTAYYKTWELLGKEKRELLQGKFSDAKEDQEDIKEEFSSVLEKIRHYYPLKNSNLSKVYDSLNDSYNDALSKREDFSSRIESIKQIGDDLFSEWLMEAKQIGNANYRAKSLSKRSSTKKAFNSTVKVLDQSLQRLDRSLDKIKDNVLFLKHNLNAQAVGSLSLELKQIEEQITLLIGQLDKSSKASDAFIKKLE